MWVPNILKRPLPNFASDPSMFIGTHNGKFHCDEVFACWMLKQLPEFANHQILRTRTPDDLERCDIVVDVGGVFDHQKKRYDHHQKEFAETMDTLSVACENGKLKCGPSLNYNTKLSAAGLIYAFYGKSVIENVLRTNQAGRAKKEVIEFYHDRLYKHFVEAIDAVDNGIKQHADEARYIMPVSLQSLIEEKNPAWNETSANEHERFEEAMKVVGDIFTRQIVYMHTAWMPCRAMLEEAIANKDKIHPSGRVLRLNQPIPWKQHLFMIEKELGIQGQLVYALYPDGSDDKKWRVQAIPISETSDFDNRCPLPAEWRALRSDDLVKASGVDTAHFVHASGFIGGASSYEGALAMASKSLEIAALA